MTSSWLAGRKNRERFLKEAFKQKKNPGHYSGVLKTNTLNPSTLLKFFVEPLRSTGVRIP
jgi:hypothetical protein